MNETEYHRLADIALGKLYDILEEADANGSLDAEYQDGIVTIGLPSNKQYIISKHVMSRELWLSSPLSGGLHFSYDGEWKLPDGRTLADILCAELKMLAGIEVYS